MYKVVFPDTAIKQLQKIGRGDARRILKKIRGLETQPRPSGCKKLAGVAHLFRIRSGDWRVIYTINDATRRVDIYHIGHRSDVYRLL